MASNDRNIPFDRQVQDYQIEWRKKHIPAEIHWGLWHGKPYEHILPAKQWHLGLWEQISKPLLDYIAVSGIQANTSKHNLKSSWTQCANIFFPFRYYEKLRSIFAGFLSEQLNVKITNIESMEFEYAASGNLAPENLLGETGGMRGANQTSPDVGVIFTYENQKKGVYLVENKYVEHSFYECSGVEKTQSKAHSERGLPPNINPERCRRVIDVYRNPRDMCQQEAWNRKYWRILKNSINVEALSDCNYCPAMNGGYQLFRQQALAQGLSESGLFDLVVSGVAYDCGNYVLLNCLKKTGLNSFVHDWPHLFNTKVKFTCFTHQNLVDYVKHSKSEFAQNWTEYITERYNYT